MGMFPGGDWIAVFLFFDNIIFFSSRAGLLAPEFEAQYPPLPLP